MLWDAGCHPRSRVLYPLVGSGPKAAPLLPNSPRTPELCSVVGLVVANSRMVSPLEAEGYHPIQARARPNHSHWILIGDPIELQSCRGHQYPRPSCLTRSYPPPVLVQRHQATRYIIGAHGPARLQTTANEHSSWYQTQQGLEGMREVQKDKVKGLSEHNHSSPGLH
jgi:hypothetical protein